MFYFGFPGAGGECACGQGRHLQAERYDAIMVER
jgi:hypothetical protein